MVFKSDHDHGHDHDHDRDHDHDHDHDHEQDVGLHMKPWIEDAYMGVYLMAMSTSLISPTIYYCMNRYTLHSLGLHWLNAIFANLNLKSKVLKKSLLHHPLSQSRAAEPDSIFKKTIRMRIRPNKKFILLIRIRLSSKSGSRSRIQNYF